MQNYENHKVNDWGTFQNCCPQRTVWLSDKLQKVDNDRHKKWQRFCTVVDNL